MLDFALLKERTKIEDVARDMLGLQLVQKGDKLRTTDNALVITPAKQVFFSFTEKKGGDSLSLVALFKQCSVKEAAEAIAAHFGAAQHSSQPNTSSREGGGARAAFDAEKYAATLDPAHEALRSLDISEKTFREWRAGYSSAGVNRGKLALPIARANGSIVAYIGRSLDRPPVLSFHKEFDPTQYVFGADRVGEGELTVVRDVLDVLRASENGADNCVAFLTETISISQIETLVALMHDKGCTALQLF